MWWWSWWTGIGEGGNAAFSSIKGCAEVLLLLRELRDGSKCRGMCGVVRKLECREFVGQCGFDVGNRVVVGDDVGSRVVTMHGRRSCSRLDSSNVGGSEVGF